MPPRATLQFTPLESRCTPTYAIGADDGLVGPAVLYTDTGIELFRVFPYGTNFAGGIRVATADVNGDNIPDLITAPGPANVVTATGVLTTTPTPGLENAIPLVKVYDGGGTHKLLDTFQPYESTFTGGVNVAAADFNGDGKAEVITGPDLGGGPRVKVFNGLTVAAGVPNPVVIVDFLAIDDANFRGGVRVAAGDFTADGVADLLVGAGYGGGPRVAGFDGFSLGRAILKKPFQDFFAFESTLRNGVYLGVGELTGDTFGDFIFGGGPGGGPRVRVANAATVLRAGAFGNLDLLPTAQVSNFFAGDPNSRQGVRVGPFVSPFGPREIATIDVATHIAAAYTVFGKVDTSVKISPTTVPGYYGGPVYVGFGPTTAMI